MITLSKSKAAQMKRQRALALSSLFVMALCGVCGMWLHIQQQQYALNRQLIAALLNGNTKTALALVNAGADPNTRCEPTTAPSLKFLLDQWLHHSPSPINNSPTAFILACGTIAVPSLHEKNIVITLDEDLPLLRAMLAHGANVHTRMLPDRAAMHTAVLKDRLHTMELLLQHGADVNERDRYGQTPLIVAVRDANVSIARLLLSRGADPNAQDMRGNTTLHYAVAVEAAGYGAKNMISELLAHGADPNLPGSQGLTPLTKATQKKRFDLTRLIKRGAK